METIDLKRYAATAAARRRPWHRNYFAMYSSVLGGITTEPLLMTAPLDDHMVHRGDGVFEAFKFLDGGLYNFAAHLERLQRSAAALSLALPLAPGDIRRVTIETVRVAGVREGVVRLFVSRGPGSFDAAPGTACGAQLYVAVTARSAPFMDRHPQGAVLGKSAHLSKPPAQARVKSCNYLINALMKMEAAERGLDGVVSFDGAGRMREGATENIGLVSAENVLMFPDPDHMLRGTTMIRVMELARSLLKEGRLEGVQFCDITETEICRAREMLIVGTTWDVSLARAFEGRPVGAGRPGPVYRALRALLEDDMRRNPRMRDEIY